MALKAEKLFFIYVARNDEWVRLQSEDWGYVSAMARFFKWWIRRYYDFEIAVEADILPVIPGKLFDRMSLALFLRDHESRGQDIYHFYLAPFKPFFTDCKTEGYTTDNFGLAFWNRPKEGSEAKRNAMFAEENCPRISHVLSHEILRMQGRKKKEYFENVHDLWRQHKEKGKPFLYYDSQFKRTTSDGCKYSTIDATGL
ncbi:hypothetical protein NTE_01717 [Candidatus Nitrososphaera evergladensis SR1]|uniref:Uncharacterized protein n=1 Tax=Candidatus Nitrososphaera evergladensis SR1 TaxID=1459636 RepID=A0A075MRJ3_9ARCH|nr:hypothetical protein NTE_01717 [Candidatus Nitrososphaera evergladensis SR1]